MSVYIDGLEMPTDDMKNIMILADGRVFQFSGYGNPKPLGTAVSVPPHGRLGDLDRLAKKVKNMAKEFPLDSIGAERYRLFAEFIKTAPTIIPASEEGET